MSLRFKFIVSYLVVVLTGILLVVGLTGRATADAFGHYLGRQEAEALVPLFEAYYQETGSWAAVGQSFPDRWMGPAMMWQRGPGQGSGHGSGEGLPSPVALANADGQIVRPGAGFHRGQLVAADTLAAGLPVVVGGQVVGRVLVAGVGASALPSAGQAFLASVNRAAVLAGLGAGLVAVVLGAMIAGGLTRSLRKLTAATEAVAGGDLGRQVDVGGRDEVGQLAASFNQMSRDLAQEAAVRRQMTADIAHELRTPLSLIVGHAEGMLDGVLPLSAEQVTVVHEEARRLDRIVEDLRTLSLADAGELALMRSPVDPAGLARQVLASRQAGARAKGVELKIEVGIGLPVVEADADRIHQVLGNLLDNALRHTPQGGSIEVGVTSAAGTVQFSVEDNGPGIPPGELDRIFERFHRSDRGRSRQQGGSGLGLAIARSLVEAHGGEIWAQSQPGGGARLAFQLPLAAG